MGRGWAADGRAARPAAGGAARAGAVGGGASERAARDWWEVMR